MKIQRALFVLAYLSASCVFSEAEDEPAVENENELCVRLGTKANYHSRDSLRFDRNEKILKQGLG